MKIGIIGAGVNGAAVAYFLSQYSAVEPIVFERDSVGSGSTGYSAGIARSFYSTPHHIRVAHRGISILRDLTEYLDTDGGFHQCGYMRFASEDNEAELRRIVGYQQDVGVDVELLDPERIPDYLPGADPTGISLAMIDHDGGFADPYLVTVGFLQAAQERGARFHPNTPVTDIRVRDGAVTHVVTDQDAHPVDFVVNAAGPWADEIGRMVGIELPVQWHESKIAVLSAAQSFGPDRPVFSDHSIKPDMYVKPEPNGNFIVGGIDRPPVDRETGPVGVGSAFLQEVSERIAQRLPGYTDADIVNTWSGIITVTPDSHQIVGVPESLDNFYNIVGGSGHGFKDAPGFAESIAESILGLSPLVDLSPYRLERFAEGELITDVDEKTHGY